MNKNHRSDLMSQIKNQPLRTFSQNAKKSASTGNFILYFGAKNKSKLNKRYDSKTRTFGSLINGFKQR